MSGGRAGGNRAAPPVRPFSGTRVSAIYALKVVRLAWGNTQVGPFSGFVYGGVMDGKWHSVMTKHSVPRGRSAVSPAPRPQPIIRPQLCVRGWHVSPLAYVARWWRDNDSGRDQQLWLVQVRGPFVADHSKGAFRDIRFTHMFAGSDVKDLMRRIAVSKPEWADLGFPALAGRNLWVDTASDALRVKRIPA